MGREYSPHEERLKADRRIEPEVISAERFTIIQSWNDLRTLRHLYDAVHEAMLAVGRLEDWNEVKFLGPPHGIALHLVRNEDGTTTYDIMIMEAA